MKHQDQTYQENENSPNVCMRCKVCIKAPCNVMYLYCKCNLPVYELQNVSCTCISAVCIKMSCNVICLCMNCKCKLYLYIVPYVLRCPAMYLYCNLPVYEL